MMRVGKERGVFNFRIVGAKLNDDDVAFAKRFHHFLPATLVEEGFRASTVFSMVFNEGLLAQKGGEYLSPATFRRFDGVVSVGHGAVANHVDRERLWLATSKQDGGDNNCNTQNRFFHDRVIIERKDMKNPTLRSGIYDSFDHKQCRSQNRSVRLPMTWKPAIGMKPI